MKIKMRKLSITIVILLLAVATTFVSLGFTGVQAQGTQASENVYHGCKEF